MRRLTYLSLPLLLLAMACQGCSTTEQQVEVLIEQLAANKIDSDNWNRAAQELMAIGRPAARQLIAHVPAAYYVGENYREHRAEIEKIRAGCAWALGRIKPRAASAALMATIDSTYTGAERLRSIWALGEIGFEQAALEAVQKELAKEPGPREDPRIRLELVLTLVKMDELGAADQVVAAVNGEDAALGQMALDGLGAANYFGVPLLVGLSQQPGPRQEQAREVLGAVREQLVAQLQDEDPEVRMQSARGLGRIGDPAVRAHLAELLQDPSNQVCFQAATALAEMGQQNGIDFLFDALRNQDPILRANAVKFLAEVQRRSGAVEKQLLEALTRAADHLSRAGAAQVLGQARVGAAMPALLTATRDDAPSVRWNAAIALGHIGSMDSRPRLRELLEDSDGTVAYYADWALRQVAAGI